MVAQLDPKYTLTGRITNSQGEPLEGLIVRAYDQDSKAPETPLVVKDAVTDAEGRYKIGFTEKDFVAGGVESGGRTRVCGCTTNIAPVVEERSPERM